MDEPLWLSREIVDALHADQVREHGGQRGLRDDMLLESALARARNRWGYNADADLVSLAAEYGFGLVRNHALVDGNKRIALVATNVFVILNGFEIEAAEPVIVDTMLQLAAGGMDPEVFAAWIRSVLVHCDVA